MAFHVLLPGRDEADVSGECLRHLPERMSWLWMTQKQPGAPQRAAGAA